MADLAPAKPFRWNIARREQLGDLATVAPAPAYEGFVEDLRRAAAKVLARAGASEVVFVGRSLESMFDYLSGALGSIDAAPSLALLHFSCPRGTAAELARRHPEQLAALHAYLAAEHLDPASLASSGKRIVFVDVVSTGATFATLAGLMQHWAQAAGVDFASVLHHVAFLGVTEQRKTSPNTWRWWQRPPWSELPLTPTAASVSVPYRYWTYSADGETKVTPSHRLGDWGAPLPAAGIRSAERLSALRRAADLYDLGRSRDERRRLARLLAATPEMREAGVRALALRLKAG
jgi:hypothetical protein